MALDGLNRFDFRIKKPFEIIFFVYIKLLPLRRLK